jgi:MFS family permease
MSIPAYVPVLIVTTAAQSLVSLAMLSPAAIAPAIAQDLQIPGSMIGWWISMAYGGAMVTSLLGGNAVRRLGATRSTQIGLLLAFIGGMAMMVGTLPLALLAALVTGLGYGMTNPAASHLLAKTTSPERRNLVFSIKQTGVPLAAPWPD